MFVLDSRLQQDSIELGHLQLCSVLLSKDANYPWFILVPRRSAVSELFDLDEADQLQLWEETTRLAAALKSAYGADKINVATLGNVVSQLHMHVIVRMRDDAAWPAPVWGRVPASDYVAEQVRATRARIKALLGEGFTEVCTTEVRHDA
ncbi:HIT family protein [Pseudomonas sp.]|uniref:HIT family protein n=1 Tax=Pseudomonas sp. TaxID=306 RepID=UPI0028A88D94|nr:HIT family protein [Pseudomonas sp.]